MILHSRSNKLDSTHLSNHDHMKVSQTVKNEAIEVHKLKCLIRHLWHRPCKISNLMAQMAERTWRWLFRQEKKLTATSRAWRSNGGCGSDVGARAVDDKIGDAVTYVCGWRERQWWAVAVKRRRSTSWCSGDIDGARDTVEMKKKANAKRDSVIARFINVVGIAITASGVQLLRPRVQR